MQWLVILLLLGGAYYLYQQLDLARAQLTLDEQRIQRLEKQLNITDESVSESSDQFQKQMEFLDTEVRKLWDNVWKRSKEQLAEHDTKIGKLEKSLESINKRFEGLNAKVAAVEKANAADKKELASLKVQSQKTRDMAETNWSEIAALKEGGNVAEKVAKLESRVKANEEWLESVNSFRKQVNRDITNLRSSVQAYHGGSSAP